MQYKRWICGGMLYGMGTFLLCGTTGSQATEKDEEAGATVLQAMEEGDGAQVAETDEDSVTTEIDCIINDMRYERIEKALQLIRGIEDQDINLKGSRWEINLLGAAVLWNHMDVAQVLVDRGADLNMACFGPDMKHYENCTPLGIAIITLNMEMIEFFIKHGADVSASILGSIPLQRRSASILGSISRQRRLGNLFQLEDEVAEANEDTIVAKIDCLFEATRNGDSENILQLIKDIKAIEDIKENKSPIVVDRIFKAMYDGNSEKALQLLEGIEDKDIDRRGSGWEINLLGAAILWNLVDVVQVLLEREADLHIPCFDPDVEYCDLRDGYYRDCTPLGMAIINKMIINNNNNDEVIKLLVEHGADVNALIVGQIPLERILGSYYARLKEEGRQGNEDLNVLNERHSENFLKDVRFFIENGANVNVKDDKGNTILHCVAGSFSRGGPFDFKFIDLLFKAGADPRLANNEGELPLQQFKPLDYVIEKFPERKEIYDELVDTFQQRIDELNAQENKSS
jgi:ankyrin repeat protein